MLNYHPSSAVWCSTFDTFSPFPSFTLRMPWMRAFAKLVHSFCLRFLLFCLFLFRLFILFLSLKSCFSLRAWSYFPRKLAPQLCYQDPHFFRTRESLLPVPRSATNVALVWACVHSCFTACLLCRCPPLKDRNCVLDTLQYMKSLTRQTMQSK